MPACPPRVGRILEGWGFEVCVSPVTEFMKAGGQPDGFMISNLPQDTFLGRMGLRSGDILKGINGQKFGNLEEFFQIYQQLQTEPTLQLEVERSNRTETLTYEIR